MRPGSPQRGHTRPLSIAPMMERTDRHFRWLMRQVTAHTLLYTEMVTTWAILHGPRERLLAFDPIERPLALQLGGDDPDALARCAEIAQAMGYDELNLNVGCPSDRVQQGCFGAVFMTRPEQVARMVEATRAACDLPVTVKHRIGVDALDSYAHMRAFVDTVAAAGADRFTVHARKAWLSGLSPKENRSVPPLRYPEVWRLKAERPDLPVEINGGILDLDQAQAQLARVDAVMIGRAAFDDPWLFRAADARFFPGAPAADLAAEPEELVRRYADYVRAACERGERLGILLRPVQGLFTGQPGARAWRRHLSTEAPRPGAGPGILLEALQALERSRHMEPT